MEYRSQSMIFFFFVTFNLGMKAVLNLENLPVYKQSATSMRYISNNQDESSLLRKNNIIPQSPNSRNRHIHLRAGHKILGRIHTSADTYKQHN